MSTQSWFFAAVVVILAIWLFVESKQNMARRELLKQVHAAAGTIPDWQILAMFHPHLPSELRRACADYLVRRTKLLERICAEDTAHNLRAMNTLASDFFEFSWRSRQGVLKHVMSWTAQIESSKDGARWQEHDLIQRADRLEAKAKDDLFLEEPLTAAHAKLREALDLKKDSFPDWIKIEQVLKEGIAIIEAVMPPEKTGCCPACD